MRGVRAGVVVVIVVGLLAWAVMAGAAGPISEVGTNDFRISMMGPDGDLAFDAREPSVALNSTTGEYLVVWQADDNTGGLVEGEFEIFAQRVSAMGGLVGDRIRVSDMGGTGDAQYASNSPAVAYNSGANEFLVVWEGEDNVGGLVANEQEIFGQRLNASGVAVGANDFRVSDMGPNGDTTFSADRPEVAYNTSASEYLVVWVGEDNVGGLVVDEFEAFGQRLSSTGAALGPNDFRISDMGGTGDADFDASKANVAYNGNANEYLVTWSGDDSTGSLVDDEIEIFGQRLSAVGAALGTNDFRISDMGSDGDDVYDANSPTVDHNPNANEYLVTWEGDDDTGGLVDEETEIFGQRLSAAGAALGPNDFRISDMGPDSGTLHKASKPAVAYNANADEYLVTWEGDDNMGGVVDDDREVFGQRLSSAGAALGANDFRISDLGPDNDPDWDAEQPAVVHHPDVDEYLVVFKGDDNKGALVNGEREVFGQRLYQQAVDDWYAMVEWDGTVYTFPGSMHVGNAPLGPFEVAVDLAINHKGTGYYVLSNLGVVHAIGPNSTSQGDLDIATLAPGERVVAMALTDSGAGYWIFTNRGRAVPFGDAPDIGDVSDLALAGEVIDAAPFPPGFYMTGTDGGVFTPPGTAGAVPFYGSVPGQLAGVPLNEPIVTIYVDAADGKGYSLAAGDGGMFNFESVFCGSIPGILPGVTLNQPIVNAVPWGDCYIFFAADGGAFAFGDKPFLGSLGDNPPDTPIVSGDAWFG